MIKSLKTLFVVCAAALLCSTPADALSTFQKANQSSLGNGVFAYSSWSEADGSTDVVVHKVPTGTSWYVEDVVVERMTDFSRGGDQASNLSAVTIAIGDAGSATRYMAATDIWTGAKATATYTVGHSTASTVPHILASGASIIARVATTGANTNQLTAGKLAIYVRLAEFRPTGQ